jgi:hypothetical protein
MTKWDDGDFSEKYIIVRVIWFYFLEV